ncbi:MAG: hypothetical protein CMM50_06540 [Rhodospirillaceae bacterium]|nr:hypothetical protein [Rhodospirillaceae bacterium]
MIVAIHQPNYLPWLGYFRKIADADAFVFLDDAQFTKNSYINRTRVLNAGKPRWLTIPVSVSLGQSIDQVAPARPDWRAAHLDSLKGFYAQTPNFREGFALLRDLFESAPTDSLAAINRHLIEGISDILGLTTRFHTSSELGATDLSADDRLIALCRKLDPAPMYLSGRGGANYQDPVKFSTAGVGLRYTDFMPKPYPQIGGDFVPGLSVVDALFNIGVEGTRAALTA